MTDPVPIPFSPSGTVTVMVTKIHGHLKKRLYLRENRKAKGVSAPQMAGRLGIERESVLRMEREWDRCTPLKQAEYAHHLGLEPEDLWFLPGTRPVPVLDPIVENESEETKEFARDILTRLVAGRRR